MRWLPREARDFARAFFAWREYVRYGRWAQDAARRAVAIVEPNVHRAVITCGPPHMAHAAGRLVAREMGLPLIVDLRDPWRLVERLPEAIASPVWLALAAWHERRAVRQAALVVTNTLPLRAAMCSAYPHLASRFITVLNGCDDESIPSLPRSRRFVIGYAGSIYLDRDPRPLFRAAAHLVRRRKLSAAEFGIELMGSVGSYDGVSLEAIAEQEGLAGFVRVHALRPRKEALAFLGGATMLATLPQDSVMAIPAKIFDYMQFDAWLLVLAERGSATEFLLRDSGADVVAPTDADTIAAVLDRRYSDHLEGRRGPRLAGQARFSRQSQARIMFDALESIVGSRRQSAAIEVPAPTAARAAATVQVAS